MDPKTPNHPPGKRTRPKRAPNMSPTLPKGTTGTALVKPKKEKLLDRLRIRWQADEDLPENEYYHGIAARFRFLKYISILLTVAFLLGMMTIFGEELTVENLRYLLRDLDAKSGTTMVTDGKIGFDRGSNQKYAIYKGDYVVVGASKTALYAPDGRTMMNTLSPFTSPILHSGARYYLVFEPFTEAGTVCLYNAFSLLHTEEVQTTLYDADIADDGTWALATDAVGYKGAVMIYDAEFDLLSTVYQDRYIWDIALNDPGDRLLILSAQGEGVGYVSEVHLLDTKSATTITRIELEGELVIAGEFTDRGFCVITDQAIRFLNADGVVMNVISFDSEIPTSWLIEGDMAALTFNRTILGREQTLCLYSSSGKGIETTIEEDITAQAVMGTSLLVATRDQLLILDCKTGQIERKTIAPDCRQILVRDENTILLCYDDCIIPLSLTAQPAQTASPQT